ncbi:MAG: peptidoglycan-binding protein [Clostridia bacterium]|nr:peptidoglycan-binding protein [Clostridia bacterium]
MKRLLAIVLLAAMCAAPLPLSLAEETSATEATELPVSEAAEQAYEPLAYGMDGEEVKRIQELLIELGYLDSNATGKFRNATRSAVKQFQREYGLEVTGVVDAETEVMLLNAEFRTIEHGDDGDDVKRLQEALINLGYLDANATGKYRNATENAVYAFQRENGLPVTGKADIELQRYLYSGNALPRGGFVTPAPASELGDVNDLVIAGDGEAVEVYPYKKKLTRGASGADVKQVQTRLTELGFFDGPISGNYMNQTIAAVKAFQTHNGMHADGVTGQDTWNMLFNSADVVDASATPRPTPAPTPVPYAITVDVKNQVTIVYGLDDNGNYTVPVRRMTCSTGTVSTPSDVGEWVLSGRRARWCYFSLYGSHAQYWTKINDNIAFHSVIYNQVDYDAMSVKSYNMLGSRASHGCIRLLVSDARWIYENIREGVVVTVTEDLPRDEELRYAVKAPPLNSARNGPVTTPQPTPEPEYISDGMPPQPFRKLKVKSSGEDVYWLQMKLKELGYYTGTVTGSYYSGTQNAVKKFQKDHGIYQTGEADVRTLEAIYADVIAANATPEPTPEATPRPDGV